MNNFAVTAIDAERRTCEIQIVEWSPQRHSENAVTVRILIDLVEVL
jgi:hypothetical protein